MSKMNTKSIDFNTFEGPVYTGRPRGESIRAKLKLDSLDNDRYSIEVLIPESTYSITSSFFLGLFGPSVTKLGSQEAFFNKYKFDAKPVFKKLFTDYVNRALQEKNLF